MLVEEETRTAQGRFTGRAFGLEIDASLPLPGIPAAAGGSSARRAQLELVSAAELDSGWPFAESESLIHRLYEETQRTALTVDRHASVGYRVFAPRYGRHIVSPDGKRIRSALPRVQPWRWQRLLFAQVIPLAATLQGLELFHASSVALDGRAVAFVGPSGTGKTSVAVNLVGRGASLVTDDVLTLEESGGVVMAHPGGGMISVAAPELDALPPADSARVGAVIGQSDKLHVAARLVDRPVPLAALYFLAREPDRRGDVVVEAAPSDPRRLLGSSFIAYVEGETQLLNHLFVCASIAASVPTFDVRVPGSRGATAVAEAIEEHALS